MQTHLGPGISVLISECLHLRVPLYTTAHAVLANRTNQVIHAKASVGVVTTPIRFLIIGTHHFGPNTDVLNRYMTEQTFRLLVRKWSTRTANKSPCLCQWSLNCSGYIHHRDYKHVPHTYTHTHNYINTCICTHTGTQAHTTQLSKVKLI